MKKLLPIVRAEWNWATARFSIETHLSVFHSTSSSPGRSSSSSVKTLHIVELGTEAAVYGTEHFSGIIATAAAVSGPNSHTTAVQHKLMNLRLDNPNFIEYGGDRGVPFRYTQLQICGGSGAYEEFISAAADRGWYVWSHAALPLKDLAPPPFSEDGLHERFRVPPPGKTMLLLKNAAPQLWHSSFTSGKILYMRATDGFLKTGGIAIPPPPPLSRSKKWNFVVVQDTSHASKEAAMRHIETVVSVYSITYLCLIVDDSAAAEDASSSSISGGVSCSVRKIQDDLDPFPSSPPSKADHHSSWWWGAASDRMQWTIPRERTTLARVALEIMDEDSNRLCFGKDIEAFDCSRRADIYNSNALSVITRRRNYKLEIVDRLLRCTDCKTDVGHELIRSAFMNPLCDAASFKDRGRNLKNIFDSPLATVHYKTFVYDMLRTPRRGGGASLLTKFSRLQNTLARFGRVQSLNDLPEIKKALDAAKFLTANVPLDESMLLSPRELRSVDDIQDRLVSVFEDALAYTEILVFLNASKTRCFEQSARPHVRGEELGGGGMWENDGGGGALAWLVVTPELLDRMCADLRKILDMWCEGQCLLDVPRSLEYDPFHGERVYSLPRSEASRLAALRALYDGTDKAELNFGLKAFQSKVDSVNVHELLDEFQLQMSYLTDAADYCSSFKHSRTGRPKFIHVYGHAVPKGGGGAPKGGGAASSRHLSSATGIYMDSVISNDTKKLDPVTAAVQFMLPPTGLSETNPFERALMTPGNANCSFALASRKLDEPAKAHLSEYVSGAGKTSSSGSSSLLVDNTVCPKVLKISAVLQYVMLRVIDKIFERAFMSNPEWAGAIIKAIDLVANYDYLYALGQLNSAFCVQNKEITWCNTSCARIVKVSDPLDLSYAGRGRGRRSAKTDQQHTLVLNYPVLEHTRGAAAAGFEIRDLFVPVDYPVDPSKAVSPFYDKVRALANGASVLLYGANGGGKSTYLNTVFEVIYLAQIGLTHPYAASVKLTGGRMYTHIGLLTDLTPAGEFVEERPISALKDDINTINKYSELPVGTTLVLMDEPFTRTNREHVPKYLEKTLCNFALRQFTTVLATNERTIFPVPDLRQQHAVCPAHGLTFEVLHIHLDYHDDDMEVRSMQQGMGETWSFMKTAEVYDFKLRTVAAPVKKNPGVVRVNQPPRVPKEDTMMASSSSGSDNKFDRFRFRSTAATSSRYNSSVVHTGECEQCGKRVLYTEIDHIVPQNNYDDPAMAHLTTRVFGGRNDPSNLRELCKECHVKKTNRDARRDACQLTTDQRVRRALEERAVINRKRKRRCE